MNTHAEMSETKAALQLEARAAWRRVGSKGTLAAATGVGKTKPAIDEMMELWYAYKTEVAKWFGVNPVVKPSIFLAVPTETLRDTGWPDEVKLWYGDEGMQMWNTCVKAVCYIAMHKYRGGIYDLVVLDEGHHTTPLNATFFDNNLVMATLALTATYPDSKKEVFKFDILNRIAPVVFVYPLEQGVEDGLIADFEINVVLCTLDDHLKVIDAGTKLKPYKTTEKKHYEYLTKIIVGKQIELNNDLPGASGMPLTHNEKAALQKSLDFFILKRAQFLYNLPSKTRLAKAVMAAEIPPEWPGLRTLVFAGSIKQCEELSAPLHGKTVGSYHSKMGNLWLDLFMKKEGINTLVCVNALNEGINIPELDQSIIVQASSNPRDMVQRVGRNVRWRETGGIRKIWVLCVQDTQDESWVTNALSQFDKARIKYVSSRSYGL